MNVIGSICIDGASAIPCNQFKFIALLKNEVQEVCVTHCLLHQHSLAVKALSRNLQNPLSACTEVVKSIKGCLNHQLFQALSESIDSKHTILPYYTGVRWPSHACVLQNIFDFHVELKAFFFIKRAETSFEFESSNKCKLTWQTFFL